MLGAIIGDIAGSFREFSKDKFPNLPLLPDPGSVPSELRPRYGFTDDSVLTVATWLALQETPATPESFRSSYYHYGNRYMQVGYGGRFIRWLQGSYASTAPYGSCGNGSAMRVSPVGWIAKTPSECADLARMSAGVTHNHPEGVKGAVFTALMIHYYLKGIPNPELVIERDHGLSYGRSLGYDHFDLTCQETLPLALHVLDSTTNFHDAVKMAVTVPRADSDTLGAIVGSIAEAKYGLPWDLAEKALALTPVQARPEISRILSASYGRSMPAPLEPTEEQVLQGLWYVPQ